MTETAWTTESEKLHDDATAAIETVRAAAESFGFETDLAVPLDSLQTIMNATRDNGLEAAQLGITDADMRHARAAFEDSTVREQFDSPWGFLSRRQQIGCYLIAKKTRERLQPTVGTVMSGLLQTTAVDKSGARPQATVTNDIYENWEFRQAPVAPEPEVAFDKPPTATQAPRVWAAIAEVPNRVEHVLSRYRVQMNTAAVKSLEPTERIRANREHGPWTEVIPG